MGPPISVAMRPLPDDAKGTYGREVFGMVGAG
jgi:hypothetical protein